MVASVMPLVASVTLLLNTDLSNGGKPAIESKSLSVVSRCSSFGWPLDNRGSPSKVSPTTVAVLSTRRPGKTFEPTTASVNVTSNSKISGPDAGGIKTPGSALKVTLSVASGTPAPEPPSVKLKVNPVGAAAKTGLINTSSSELIKSPTTTS